MDTELYHHRHSGAVIDIVEDETLFSLGLQALLDRHGLHLRHAYTTPAAACEGVRQDPPEVLLVDLHLQSEADGLDVIRNVRDNGPETAIVLLTASSESLLHARAVAAGADDIVVKHNMLNRLLHAITGILPDSSGSVQTPIEEAPEVLQNNLQTIATVQEWAELMGYTRKSFHRAFSRHFRRKPHKELCEARKTQLIHLLQSRPGRPVCEIAKEMGFAGDTGLYRFVRRHFECTFNELRSRFDE